jgi:hypothetical protein
MDHLLPSMRATSTPGASRSASGIESAPERHPALADHPIRLFSDDTEHSINLTVVVR